MKTAEKLLKNAIKRQKKGEYQPFLPLSPYKQRMLENTGGEYIFAFGSPESALSAT
ncbi:hypothetical protein [Undibacterium sp. WLX3042]|uniref:hypothetical protein n=1 Tax=Undibacterium sp. WLX3042 TaxID=3412686 RepID=UPI003C2D7B1F